MKKTEINKLEEIKFLEKQISKKLGAYKDLKKSGNNEKYFTNLHYKVISKLEEKNSKTIFSFNPAIGYAMLFIISFAVSFQFINFSDEVTLNSNEAYLFSETTLWLEEAEYFSTIVDEEFNLDYASYMNSELNYANNISFGDEMSQLSESEINEIYENLKSKKIL